MGLGVIVSCKDTSAARKALENPTVPNAPLEAIVLKPTPYRYTIRLTGTVRPNEQVDLRPQTSGRIEKLYFEEGQRVQQGQLLVKLDDDALVAQLKEVQVRTTLAESDVKRKQALLGIQAVSAEEVEVAINEVARLQAQADLIKAQLAYTELRAPFSGVIGLRLVSVGSYLTPNDRVASLQALNPAKLEFELPERIATEVKQGQALRFRVGEDRQTPWREATVYALEPSIDPSSRARPARALAPNADGQLVPGAFVEIELVLQELENALMLPAEAAEPVLDGTEIFRVRNGKAEKLLVETGIRTESAIQLVDGVAAGDTVLITGLLSTRDGADVSITVVNADSLGLRIAQ